MRMKRLAWLTTLVLATLMLVVLLWQFRTAALMFLVSLGIAAAVRPAIDHLIALGRSRGQALALTYGVALALLGILFYAISGSLLVDLQLAADDLAASYEQITTSWPSGSAFQQAVVQQLPPPQTLYQALALEEGEPMVETVLGFTSGLLDFASNLIIVLVLSIYWSFDHERFERLWLSLLSVEQRARARDIWRSIERGVGSYIRSELVQGLLAALLLGLGFWAFGLRYPTLLALAAALAWLIPWVGVALAVIPVLLVGVTQDVSFGLLMAAYTFSVLLILEAWVEPRLFNRRRYSAILIVLVMLAMADAFGLVGIITAPPLAAAIQLFFSRMFYRTGQPVAPTPAFQASGLTDRLSALRVMVSGMPQQPPEVVSMLSRLEALYAAAIELLPQETREDPAVVADTEEQQAPGV